MNIIVASRKCGASLVVTAMILETLFPAGIIHAAEVVPPDSPTAPETVVNDIASTTPPTVPDVPEEPAVLDGVVSSTDLFDVASSTEAAIASSTATSTEPFGNDDIDIVIATSSSTSTPSIETGDAVALANIVNVANTTLVNSDGYIVFSNLFDNYDGSIDFRNPASSTNMCGFSECAREDIRLTLLNDAFIINDVMLRALSGNNLIEGGGTSTIETGDAYAGLNLINVVNTNFIDSNYILIALNAFRGINGDIIFPSLLSFLSQGGYTPVDTLLTENVANVVNNATSTADSGNNTTHGAENGSIETGDSHSTSNVFNQINTTLAGGNNISLLFKINGNWSGQIWGVPTGFELVRGEDGSIYLTTSGSTIPSFGSLGMNATNTASITNNLDVAALSGQNEITGARTALISTGDAYAGINLMNIANANVIGRNWMLAIINIFGDFNGNIAFGRPDLWVGEQIGVSSPIENGTEMTYTITITNNGDSDASDVVLTDVYDSAHIDVLASSLPYTTNEAGNHLWDIGNIPVGVTKTVTYTAQIKDTTPGTDITNVVSVRGVETDNDMVDNTDTATVQTTPPPPPASGGGGNGIPGNIQVNTIASGVTPPALDTTSGATEFRGLQVIRKTASSTVSTTRTVAQTLVVINPSDTIIPSVMMQDILRDPGGVLVRNEEFDLGNIMPREEITITYEITFSDEAIPGIYTLSTILKKPAAADMAFAQNGEIVLTHETPETAVTTTETILPFASSFEQVMDSFVEAVTPSVAEADTPAEPQVLGAATEDTAPDFLPYELIYLLSLIIPLLFLYWVMRRSLVW